MTGKDKLPKYQLYVHPLDLRELKKDIWNEEPVPGQLTINKRKFDVDIVYRGSHIRKFAKKSYNVSFYKPSNYQGKKEIHLNAEYKDPSMIRNKLSLDFFSDIGVLSPESQFIFLQLNGRKEGIYLELESVDENFLKKRGLPNGSIFYAVDGDANFSLLSDLDEETKKSLLLGYERKCGNKSDDYHLQQFIFVINTLLKQEFEKEIIHHLDVEKYLRWLAGVVLTQNYDGFVHNYALYRNGDTGLFEIIPWDYDATWGRDVNGKYMEEDYVRIEGYNTLTARLLDVTAFRKKYRSMLAEFLTNQYTVDYLRPKIEYLFQLIEPYIPMDPYKKDDLEKFKEEPNLILEFIHLRNQYLISKLKSLD
ncbi:CotH kinase family protein [Bacillus sp. FJAT-49736]|uniref:CotH kinase family protein n=1 Tax=Bacillus sp. FJAT-49736 TaxID=2833582 RepID=UPI001BC8D785|nr:CotH kinase family protein [Bacillus sp. FJAT-49736]MBS4174969.1 CotH kinase family protein [Bacillus sp. FJAT-49736]